MDSPVTEADEILCITGPPPVSVSVALNASAKVCVSDPHDSLCHLPRLSAVEEPATKAALSLTPAAPDDDSPRIRAQQLHKRARWKVYVRVRYWRHSTGACSGSGQL